MSVEAQVKMDTAALAASMDLEGLVLERGGTGEVNMGDISDWYERWYIKAGYKRLTKAFWAIKREYDKKGVVSDAKD